MTISFKISENTKEKMIEYYKDLKREKTPPYAIFQADEGGTVITLYESSKVVFQGISADIDANLWIETEKLLNGKSPIENKKKEKKKDTDINDYYFVNSIGSDEVGTGDFFGPIIVTSSYVSVKDIGFLEELGVRDSKKITDEKILKIAPSIIEKIPHETYILTNPEYNDLNNKGYNMNKIKAVLHNKVLLALMKKDNFKIDKIIVDQFTTPRSYFSYLKNEENVLRKITFTPRAEDKCLSVACSSIISRYLFLNEMSKLSKELDIYIPKGASTLVDDAGKKIVEKYGKEKLKEISKYNFKNTEKILKF